MTLVTAGFGSWCVIFGVLFSDSNLVYGGLVAIAMALLGWIFQTSIEAYRRNQNAEATLAMSTERRRNQGAI